MLHTLEYYLTHLPQIQAQLIPENIIGKGANGLVYKVEISGESHPIVIKRLGRGSDEGRMVSLIQASNQSTFLPMMVIDIDEESSLLVSEYCDFNLHDFLQVNNFTPQQRQYLAQMIFVDVIEAVKNLAILDILHNDIKPQNIVWSHRYKRWFLIDFGSAKRITPEEVHPDFTPGFVAPEKLAPSYPVTTHADIYSLGATLHTILDMPETTVYNFMNLASLRDAFCERVNQIQNGTLDKNNLEESRGWFFLQNHWFRSLLDSQNELVKPQIIFLYALCMKAMVPEHRPPLNRIYWHAYLLSRTEAPYKELRVLLQNTIRLPPLLDKGLVSSSVLTFNSDDNQSEEDYLVSVKKFELDYRQDIHDQEAFEFSQIALYKSHTLSQLSIFSNNVSSQSTSTERKRIDYSTEGDIVPLGFW